LLLMADLAQIQNDVLHRLAARQPVIFHHADTPMALAFLPAIRAAQEHVHQQSAGCSPSWKSGQVFTRAYFELPVLAALGTFSRLGGKGG